MALEKKELLRTAFQWEQRCRSAVIEEISKFKGLYPSSNYETRRGDDIEIWKHDAIGREIMVRNINAKWCTTTKFSCPRNKIDPWSFYWICMASSDFYEVMLPGYYILDLASGYPRGRDEWVALSIDDTLFHGRQSNPFISSSPRSVVCTLISLDYFLEYTLYVDALRGRYSQIRDDLAKSLDFHGSLSICSRCGDTAIEESG